MTSQEELDQLAGGVIAAAFIQDGGLHVCLCDGRRVIFAADEFCIGITHFDHEKLH